MTFAHLRLNRVYEGKKDVVVYDYVDAHIGFFDRQYKNRLTAYKKLGYRVLSGSVGFAGAAGGVGFASSADSVGRRQQVNAIYSRWDYSETFERDLVEANSEILIASPGLLRSKVERMISLVKPRQEAGVTVTVITMDPESEGFKDTIELHILIDEMKQNGIFVRLTEQEGEHFAVIDRKLVWHGGMNLLGKEDVWDNLIRVESVQAAGELLEMGEMETDGEK